MKTQNGFTRFDTEEEFKTWLKNKSISRTVNKLQIHHTGSPSYSDFYKSGGGLTADGLAGKDTHKKIIND